MTYFEKVSYYFENPELELNLIGLIIDRFYIGFENSINFLFNKFHISRYNVHVTEVAMENNTTKKKFNIGHNYKIVSKA